MFLDGVRVAAALDQPSEPYLLGSLGPVGGNVRRRRPLAFIGSPPPYRSRETGACASRRPSISPRSPICWVPSAGRGHGRPRGAQRTVKSMRSGNDATTSRPLAVAPGVEFGVPPIAGGTSPSPTRADRGGLRARVARGAPHRALAAAPRPRPPKPRRAPAGGRGSESVDGWPIATIYLRKRTREHAHADIRPARGVAGRR